MDENKSSGSEKSGNSLNENGNSEQRVDAATTQVSPIYRVTTLLASGNRAPAMLCGGSQIGDLAECDALLAWFIESPHREARIEVSHDDGDTWEPFELTAADALAEGYEAPGIPDPAPGIDPALVEAMERGGFTVIDEASDWDAAKWATDAPNIPDLPPVEVYYFPGEEPGDTKSADLEGDEMVNAALDKAMMKEMLHLKQRVSELESQCEQHTRERMILNEQLNFATGAAFAQQVNRVIGLRLFNGDATALQAEALFSREYTGLNAGLDAIRKEFEGRWSVPGDEG